MLNTKVINGIPNIKVNQIRMITPKEFKELMGIVEEDKIEESLEL